MADTFLHGVEVLEIDGGTRPVTTVRSSVIGMVGTAPKADAATFPLNTPVLIAGSQTLAAKLGTEGTLPDAMDSIFAQCGAVVIVVRVEDGATDTETTANVVGGVDAVTGQYRGVKALLGAQSALGYSPRILLAPGFTHQRPEDPQNAGKFLANPVVAALIPVANQLRAVIIKDGPNTNDADAIADAGDFGSARVYVCDPWVQKEDSAGNIVVAPVSPIIAGLIAKTDNDNGFWFSPSNQTINGIVGTSRPVDFALGDKNCRANLLNEANVATVIRQDGYRLWGNRTLSSDPKYQFLSVRRTADIINDSLVKAHLWAVDRNISKTYVHDVVESVNAYLRYLTGIGAILGGVCYADPDLNSADLVSNGKVFFDFDFTAPYPAEHITFRSHMVNDYLTEIF